MTAFDQLKSCAGDWRGESQLVLSPGRPAEVSESTMAVTPILQGRFVRVEQTWSRNNAEQQGVLLVGFDPKSGALSGHWVDTFHMGHAVMALAGSSTDGDTLDLLGSYAAPPGPDWGWRIVVEPKPNETLGITMFNIDPEGQEALAVKAEYTPA